MSPQRANARALALAHIAENLAYALPAYQATIHDQLRTTTGYPDHTPGAAPATTTPTPPLTGQCTQPVPARAAHPDWPGILVDCGYQRPCPEHDRPTTLTPTEHTAAQRSRLHNELADIDQTITTTTTLLNELLQRARRAVPPPPPTTTQCRDGQTGKDGTITWGDTTCRDTADKAGLCNRHYMAWYRWRREHGVDTSRMFQPTHQDTR